MKSDSVIFALRITVFVLLIAGSFLDWKKLRTMQQIIDLKNESISALERIVAATEKTRDLYKQEVERAAGVRK